MLDSAWAHAKPCQGGMQPVLIGIGVYLLAQFAVGMLVSRRIASEADYLRRGAAARPSARRVLDLRDLVRSGNDRRRRGLDLQRRLERRLGGSVRLRAVSRRARRLHRRAALAAAIHDVRRHVSRALFGWSRALRRAADGADLGAVGGRSDSRVRPSRQRVVGARSGDRDRRRRVSRHRLHGGGRLACRRRNRLHSRHRHHRRACWCCWSSSATPTAVSLRCPQLVDPARLALFSTGTRRRSKSSKRGRSPSAARCLPPSCSSRILGCNSAATARNATLLGAGIYLVVGLIPVAIGLAGPALVPGLEEPEQVVATLAQRHLSTFFYVLFAGAVISAILSTVNSCLLAAAALVSHNLIIPLKPAIDERGKVLFARIGVVVFGIAAYALALGAEGIYELVATASAFGSAGIFVVGLFGLFSRFGGRGQRPRGARRRHARVGSGRILARLVDAVRRRRRSGAPGLSRGAPAVAPRYHSASPRAPQPR